MIVKKKKRAVVFVDFENWYFSYTKLYGSKPKIGEWHQDLKGQFHKLDIYFFADFSRFISDMALIKMTADHIIDTRPYGRKNMTDFIMLDYIYKMAGKRTSPMYYIIFSGDGHFEPVAKYLKNERGREVIIYGIRGSFSGQLKTAASKFIEIPKEFDQWDLAIRMIVKKMDYIERQQEFLLSHTYAGLAWTISLQLDTQLEEIESVLEEMLAKQYLIKKDAMVSNLKNYLH